MKSLSVFTLAVKAVTGRPVRSGVLALIVAAFAFVLVTAGVVSSGLQRGIESLSARMGADLLVVPQGAGKKIEQVLLQATPTSFLLPESMLETVKGIPEAEHVTGQLFISSLNAQCCTVKVQLIGIDEATDFVVTPWLKKALPRTLADNEVIVGDYIFGNVGETLTFFDTPFKIAARLEATGTGFDASVFMTMAAARKLAYKAIPAEAQKAQKSVSAVLVGVKPGTDVMKVSDAVLDKAGLRSRVNFVYASNLMSDTSARFSSITGLIYRFAGALWVAAAVILFITFYFAFAERIKEFALLRALGMSAGKVAGMVVTEAFLTGLLGTAFGIAAGLFCAQIFSGLITQTIGLPYLAADSSALVTAALQSAAAGLVIAPAATLLTLFRLKTTHLCAALREDK